MALSCFSAPSWSPSSAVSCAPSSAFAKLATAPCTRFSLSEGRSFDPSRSRISAAVSCSAVSCTGFRFFAAICIASSPCRPLMALHASAVLAVFIAPISWAGIFSSCACKAGAGAMRTAVPARNASARTGLEGKCMDGMSKMRPDRANRRRPGRWTYILAAGYWADTIFRSDSTVPSCFSVPA